ncbi:MAG TPA: hypothetical protein VM242_02395 [Acidimicrobiales bacterium]|jgi:hypothetical protein|nr:hypothetical protein [Acidimicrobiales bacterium]
MDNPAPKVRIVDGKVTFEADISPPADPDVLVALNPSDEGVEEANPARVPPERWITLAGG